MLCQIQNFAPHSIPPAFGFDLAPTLIIASAATV